MDLIIDGYNLFHRSRFSFVKGPNFVVFNFFRSLKVLVEKFEPSRVFLTLEGSLQKRKDIFPQYKNTGTRIHQIDSDAARAEYEDFKEQKNKILELLKLFPITIALEPEWEGDDLVYNLAKASEKAIVISSDTDFIQLLDLPHVSLYNPIKDEFVSKPEYDYVSYKSLMGDKTDNIPGIPKVGKVTAEKILKQGLQAYFKDKIEQKEIFDRNVKLVKLMDIPNFSIEKYPENVFNEEEIKSQFIKNDFWSIVNKTSWPKFIEPFRSLDGKRNNNIK
jgi:5'-3' exonuclease